MGIHERRHKTPILNRAFLNAINPKQLRNNQSNDISR